MKPVMLCIMDGWGERPAGDPTTHNAVALAATPVFDALRRGSPHALLNTSGADVGLPDGQMGNSEVGHMNIGAGRVVMQDLPRINRALTSGAFAQNAVLQEFTRKLKASGGVCHLMGLLSPGGVHSHQDHLAALANEAVAAGVSVAVHAILDGRDTPPRSAEADLARFAKAVSPGSVTIATVIGRFYALDRDQRWERVGAAHRAFVEGEAETPGYANAEGALIAARDRGETDEFVAPSIIADYQGMQDGDGLLMANFRADRAREILSALLDPDFDGFERTRHVEFAAQAGMVDYSDALSRFLPALFPAQKLAHTIGEVVAGQGLRQLRAAETEKYPHVTFFLNGGHEEPFAGEARILIPSPRVKTYDLQPEMSAPALTDQLVEAIGDGGFDLIIANFANPDMVGHTGDLKAAVAAVETVDTCVGRVAEALRAAGGVMLLTADHGNCETMRDEKTGAPHTSHTTNPVPCILVNPPDWVVALTGGRLADVAPTLLNLMGIPAPEEMEGRSLLVLADNARPATRAAQ